MARRTPIHTARWREIPEPQRRAWLTLVKVERDVRARLEDALARTHGLSLAEWDALANLGEFEDGLRMADLAERVLLSPSGLTRMIDRLVQRGFVERARGGEDAREMLVRVTPRGLEILSEASLTHNHELVAHFLSKLPAKDWALLADLLSRIAAAPERCERHAGA